MMREAGMYKLREIQENIHTNISGKKTSQKHIQTKTVWTKKQLCNEYPWLSAEPQAKDLINLISTEATKRKQGKKPLKTCSSGYIICVNKVAEYINNMKWCQTITGQWTHTAYFSTK